jgi:hypothetical protein
MQVMAKAENRRGTIPTDTETRTKQEESDRAILSKKQLQIISAQFKLCGLIF